MEGQAPEGGLQGSAGRVREGRSQALNFFACVLGGCLALRLRLGPRASEPWRWGYWRRVSMATAAAVDRPAARFAKDHLKAFVERVERLEEEKKAITDDIRDVYAEAKANGFDVKALRVIVRLRKQDADE